MELEPKRYPDDALCKGTDPDLFFSEHGGPNRTAEEFCSYCPVKAACLEYSIVNRIEYGVWGGMGEEARKVIIRNRGIRKRRSNARA